MNEVFIMACEDKKYPKSFFLIFLLIEKISLLN
jgi:hypothetical protein